MSLIDFYVSIIGLRLSTFGLHVVNIDRCMDRGIDEQMYRRIDRQMIGQIDIKIVVKQMNRWMVGKKNRWIYKQIVTIGIDELINSQIDSFKDGWMEEKINKLINEQID